MNRQDFRIFLGNPPWRKKNRIGVRAGSRWPFTMSKEMGEKVPSYVPFPFFLAYSTSVLEKKGFETYLVDAIASGVEDNEFLQLICDFQPKITVIETSTPSFNADIAIAEKIKQRVPETFLVWCGSHVSIMKKQILNDHKFVDAIMIGEYEFTLLELAECLLNKKPVDKVLGLIYRNSDGVAVENSRRPVIENLDELPRPAYHHLPMYNYNDDFRVLEKPNVQMWASRGCPYKCIFCMWPQVMYGNHKYRVRSPESVVDEMEWLLENYGFKGVYIDDDTFNIGKERLLKLCRLIKERDLQMAWGAMARADTFDEETLAAMAESGLVGIKYGIESAVQSIVDASGKALNLEKARETIKFTQKHGVKVHLTFTFGLPGETKETIEKTINFALELKPYSAQFSINTPFPGTSYYDELKSQNRILTDNWDDFDGNLSSVMKPDNLTAEDLQNALDRAIKTYWEKRETWV